MTGSDSQCSLAVFHTASAARPPDVCEMLATEGFRAFEVPPTTPEAMRALGRIGLSGGFQGHAVESKEDLDSLSRCARRALDTVGAR